MFRRIVCATDHSPAATVATRYAAALARAFGSKLELVHAWNWLDELPSEYTILRPEAVAESRRADEQRLAKAAEELRAQGVDVSTKLVDGAPDQALVAHAVATKADLIVTGTEGRRGVAHALLGSVAERILRTSDVPVLAVPKSTTLPSDGKFAPASILVPVDLSPASAEILRLGVVLGERTGARVVALHAWTALTLQMDGPAVAEAEKRATENVDGWVREVLGDARDAIEVVVRHRMPAEAILDFVAERKPELVMMATAGRTGLQHFMLGSVTELTLRTAGRPVLTYRRPASA